MVCGRDIFPELAAKDDLHAEDVYVLDFWFSSGCSVTLPPMVERLRPFDGLTYVKGNQLHAG